MKLRLSNTLSGDKEDFVPINPERILMYVCGPTVYNYIHIGNARPVVIFDLLYRLLKRLYVEVCYVRNITDIEDKIIAAADAEGVSTQLITQRYSKAFYQDITALNVLAPTAEPRATEHIEAMQRMIERLIASGHAYHAEGHILFDVSTMQDYGRLSHQDMEQIVAGARVEVASYKKHPSDFVLWKPSSSQQPGWESPWGKGRPGWHLECSVMVESLLGDTIDIHGGGMDLIFPHHENEIAQSECAHHGQQFVRYWVHNGYITVKGDKMAKSAGNFVFVRDVLQQFHGECVRLALINVHYKKPLDWSIDNLQQAQNNLDKWYRLLLGVPAQEAPVDDSVVEAVCDDLNTPQAIAELHRLASDVTTATSASERVARAGILKASANFLGLLMEAPQVWMHWRPASEPQQISDEEIERLIAEREQARRDKDYATADKIRQKLSEVGVVLEDSEGGTRWLR